jgi:peptide/nickel transport system permease protein
VKSYIAWRILEAFLTLLVLTFLVFISAHATGDPARMLLPPEGNAEELARLRRLLGLDQPLYVQFTLFVTHALQGDLGRSIVHNRPVIDMLGERLWATLTLALTAIAVSAAVAIPLGVIAAARRGGMIDKVVRAVSIVGMSAPQFWVGIILIVIFSSQLGLLPAFGYGEPADMILPVVTLGLGVAAGMIRLTRSSMLDVLHTDYVKFGRLKGLSERRVVWKHALRNAMIPFLTFAGITLGQALNGAIVVESVFAWPGVGRLTLDAVIQRNFPLLQGAVLLGGLAFILSSLFVDLLYARLDPRIGER